MKLLVAVKSCASHLDLGYHYKIRETWGTGLNVKFFIGDNLRKHEADEVILDAPDDYHSLPKKTQAICQWATGKMIDYLFICDTDTFVVPSMLLTCGFGQFDYVGKIDKPFGEPFPYQSVDRDGQPHFYPRCYPWASGGYGYFLSRKAFTIIADKTPAGFWAEDMWVGNVLGPLYATGEITMFHTPPNEYSWHFPAHEYNSGYDLKFGWMEKMYQEHR
jgi:hypothetical protein